MIVVTGVGRTGTSLVAAVYRSLGFDVRGAWDDAIDAGLEDPDVVRLNRAIASDLGLGLPVDSDLARHPVVRSADGLEARHLVGSPPPPTGPVARALAPLVPARVRRPLRGWAASLAAHVRARSRTSWRAGNRRPRAVEWRRWDEVVSTHGPALRAIAAEREVVKDPRFCWTLGVWLAAGAPVGHVVLCTRNMAATVASRGRVGHVDPAMSNATNTLIYGLGLCQAAISDHRVSHGVVRFPDFLTAPDVLYDAMRFPRPVERGRFLEAFTHVVTPDRVHDWQ